MRRLAPLLSVALLLVVGLALHHQLRAYHFDDVLAGLRAVPRRQIAVALGLTVLSYWILTGYDTLALRSLRRPLPYRRTALASFLGYTFAHNLGLSILGGAAPRYRFYTAWGFTPGQVARVVAFTAATFWLGIFAISGVALLADTATVHRWLHLEPALGRTLGVTLLLVAVGYLVGSAVRRRPIRIRGWSFRLPSPGIALAQLAVGVSDWCVAAAVLYVLLPSELGLPLVHFVGLFVVAQLAGAVSHVPGGLGVFESVILFALAPHAPAPDLLGALLVYRVLYYLCPLALATVLLAAYEALQRRARLARVRELAGAWLPEVAPRVLAFLIFAGGGLLLLSGATPRHPSRLDWLRELVPLAVVEASHFLASLVGLGLILLASGLQRRLDAAYHLAVGLLAAGATLALLKGFDWEESLVLLTMMLALIPCRREFHRRASLVGERFTMGWAVAVTAAVAASVWLGFFVHKHAEYSHELWWEFSFLDDAPRFLRASVGVCVAALAFAGWHLMRPARLRQAPADDASIATAREIVAASPIASAHLALLGDKSFLFGDSGRSFVMYAVSGRSCVAMGDPVGPRAEVTDLVWVFKELCDRHGHWPVFYEASAATLPSYLDAGLVPLKFGEEARVALPELTLEGSSHKQQRYLLRAVERDGGVFEVVPKESVPEILPALAEVSIAWLAEKRTREKAFSLGCFEPRYLRELPVAVVRVGGEIVAFANLWCSGESEEVSPDLMRFRHDAPPSVMEYLFIQIALWARQQGYRWLNLGMAPLSGLDGRATAPLWNRAGALAFRYGEQFYNFQGLRRFKEKFHPEWRPKYLIYPGGVILPRVLANLAALVSGGLRGALTR